MNSNEETKFEVGDVVEWCGVRGVVTDIGECGVHCFFDHSYHGHIKTYMFDLDGKSNTWHTEPSLKLISKAKKKRKVKLYANLHKNTFGVAGGYGSIQYTATDIGIHSYIRVPELDKEVEIDE